MSDDILNAIHGLSEALANHRARGPLRIDLDFEAGQAFERQVIERSITCVLCRGADRDEHGIPWRSITFEGIEVRSLAAPIPDWQLKKSGYLR